MKKKAGAGRAKKFKAGKSLKKSRALANPQSLPSVLALEADSLFGKRGKF